MNKRILKLAEQAGGDFYTGFAGSPNSVKFMEQDLAKFAELIIRECANVVLEPHNGSNFIISMSKCKFSTRQAIDRAAQTGGLKCDTESVSNQILKHFGVSE